MVFSSTIFLFIFFPVVWLLHLVIPSIRVKNWLLAVFSLLFYAFGEPLYVFLMLLSVAVNFFCALEIGAPGTVPQARRRAILWVTLGFNLLMLGVFKYTGFAVELINLLPGVELPVPAIRLPIGISFYTFQILSYVIDVYRGDVEPQPRFGSLFLYISFFPQLVAGPIVKYHEVAARIDARRVTAAESALGMRRFIFGLFKKLVVSNTCALIVDAAFAAEGLTAPFAWLGAIAYCFQIYYDFSGYSDMAIGLGHLFGFTFSENFNYPYVADSVCNFWRRWHISLSSWFREYLYIPLGGNRRGRARTVLNKYIVFFTTGLWHGASLNFIVWGLFHGSMQMIEQMLRPTERRRLRPLWRVVTAAAVCLSFVVFRADNMTAALAYLGAMFTPAAGAAALSPALVHLDAFTLTVLAGAVIFSVPLVPRIAAWGRAHRLEWASYALTLPMLLLCVMTLASSTYNPFIYFRF